MRIAVTGAGGFLGRALISRLLEKSYQPVAIVRSDDDAGDFERLGLEVVFRDLTDPGAYADLFNGCDMVVHCAALARDFGHWEEFRKANVEVTANVIAAAERASIKRLIHISTTAVYGNERNHYGADEEANFGQRVVDPYTRSKIMADQVVLGAIADRKFPATILRFGNIWGPGDPNILPFIVDGLRTRRLRIEGGGDNVLSLTYVRNAVEGIVLAMEKNGACGMIYNITDGIKVTSKKFIDDIVTILGIEYRLRNVPYPLLYSAAYAIEQFYLMANLKSKPPLTRFVARILKYHAMFDISRAISEIDYHPVVSYKQALTLSTSYIRALYYGQK
jgi:nucleoside-diphosphate-sugar epimerase